MVDYLITLDNPYDDSFFFSLNLFRSNKGPSSRKFSRDLEREVEGGKERKVRSGEERLYKIPRLGAKAHLPPSCFAKALANPLFQALIRRLWINSRLQSALPPLSFA